MSMVDALKQPMNDGDWMKKCGMVGLLTLIPLVGPFAVLGWSIRYFQNLNQGDGSLPESFSDVGGDIGRGFKYVIANFIAFLPFILIIFCAGLLAPILGQIDQSLATVGAILSLLITLPVSLILAVLAPAVQYTHLATGSMVIFGSLGSTVGMIKRAPGAYVMAFIGLIVAQIVGQLGVIACFIGIFLTLPLGMAMQMAVFHDWAQTANSNG